MQEPTGPEQTSHFDTMPLSAEGYNEAYRSTGTARDHWHSLIAAFDAITPSALDQSQERVRRMRHEDGATFNPFDDSSEAGTSWALEMIPMPITAGEWQMIEAGLIQRAQLLELILADVYGPQNLMRDGHLPAELIFANPCFLRSCHGITPAGSKHLTFYATDIYRDRQGRFRVFRDYGDTPIGLGYALENRIVISRVFSDLYHKNQVQRLAPFFHTLHNGLVDRAPEQRDDPRIVLLTPGPESRVYFEHALIARYLGYPLVEGQDLTVRNGDVFLKKLAGLEPVQTIFRHIADANSDPFAGSRTTAGGVAGLIQALRQGQIGITNPIGSGFVDTPALSAFLPELCRQVLGTEMQLENHPAWYCGAENGRSHVLANLGELRVGPAMQWSASAALPDDPAQAINAAPHRYLAREPLRPSTVPAWSPKGVTPQFAMMRVFTCATEDGFAVMPGGLAITAPDVPTLLSDTPERQQSKDIWVISDQPVAPFSLMHSLQSVAFKRGSDLPSRVADHLLWLGRYLERAEGLIRLLRCIFRRLAGEARPVDIPELPFLMKLLRLETKVSGHPKASPGIPLYRELMDHLNDLLFRADRSNSVAAILKRVQNAAKNVRDRLSLDCWRVINHLEGFSDNAANDPLELLDETLFTLSAFSGLAMESMTRGLGWRFMDMGRRVERAVYQKDLVRIGLPLVCEASRSSLEALLEVADSIMTYRARYRTAFQLSPVLDLLLIDESNPKSLAFQCSQIASHVEALPRQDERRFATLEERLALEMLTTVRLLDVSGIDCQVGDERYKSLQTFLETIGRQLNEFARQISAHYLTRIPETPHFSNMHGDGRS